MLCAEVKAQVCKTD